MSEPAVTGPSPEKIPARTQHARMRNFRGKTFLAVDNQALELTEIAAFIWKCIDGTKAVSAIAQVLATEYEVDASTALTDVAELLGMLARAGLVKY